MVAGGAVVVGGGKVVVVGGSVVTVVDGGAGAMCAVARARGSLRWSATVPAVSTTKAAMRTTSARTRCSWNFDMHVQLEAPPALGKSAETWFPTRRRVRHRSAELWRIG